MKKSVLVIGIILIMLIALVVLTGCGSSSKPIVGSWEYESSKGYIYKFNEDGTGSYTAFGTEREFTYEDNGTELTIKYNGDTAAGTYKYTIEDKKLTIKDSFDNDVVYVKK